MAGKGNNANNVATGKPSISGAIFFAPLGTALPTDAKTSLDKAFKCVGYASDDGVSNNIERSSDNKKAWGGDIVYTAQTEKTDEYKWTMLEVKDVDVLKLVYGSENVTGTLDTGVTIKHNSKELDELVFVIDMVLGDTLKRVVIPNGKITNVAEVSYKDEDLIGYETTVTAKPTETGDTSLEYLVKKGA